MSEFIIENGILTGVDVEEECVVIPDGVTVIEADAFKYCHKAVSIIIPDTVTDISEEAFLYVSPSLTQISVGEGNPAYRTVDGDLYTADGKKLIFYAIGKTAKRFVIPDRVEEIGTAAFRGCKWLEEIVIHSGVRSIGDRAFVRCASLTRIRLPEGIKSIGENSFAGCASLAEIHIPDSVTDVGGDSFSDCISLNRFTVGEKNTAYKAMDGSLYTADGSVLIYYVGGGKSGSVRLPDGVKEIGKGAFCHCEGVESITLPQGVTVIREGAFSRCGKLSRINIPDSVNKIGEDAFIFCVGLTDVCLTNGLLKLEDGAFSGCKRLERIEIPGGVERLGRACFYGCDSLKEVRLSEGLRVIDAGAFCECMSITEITVPNGVTMIGRGAFRNCLSLKRVTLPPSVAELDVEIFHGCKLLEEIFIGLKQLPLLGDFVNAEAFLAGIRGAVLGEGHRPLTVSEDKKLNRYIKKNMYKFKELRFDDCEFLRFLINARLLRAELADALLDICTDAQCRVALIGFLHEGRSGGELDTADRKLRLE